MSISLVLHENKDGPIIWRLDNLDRIITGGIVDSLFYAFVDDPNRDNYVLYIFKDQIITSHITYRGRLRLVATIGQTIDKLDAHIARAYTDPRNFDSITIVLRPLPGSTKYRVIFDKTPERYLQGLLTITSYYNIDIDDILARKPYKNGQYYNIN